MSFDQLPWVIRAENLSKTYRLYDQPHHRLLQSLAGSQQKYYREFDALKSVSFQLQSGETMGIIGANGAGKSTILQLLCGTLEPTQGTVQVKGRISALLELGAGFNPEFTGRENLIINAAILGLSPNQIEARTEDIIAFADIGEFIDRPVKTYSSGMYVRVAFAVAVHVDPQILIVDEALAVGDALFQFKCMSRMRRMLDDGVALLFTSHDVSAIKALCQRALWLEKGQVRMLGDTADVTRAYDQEWVMRANLSQNNTEQNNAAQENSLAQVEEDAKPSVGTSAVEIVSAHWGADGMMATQARAQYGDTLQLRVLARVKKPCQQLVLSYHIKNKQNQNVVGGHTACEPLLYQRHWQGGETFEASFELKVEWHAGDYALTLLVASIGDVQHYSDVVFHCWEDHLATLSVVQRQQFPLSDMVEPQQQVRIVDQAPWFILDDFFPNLLTGFRVAEFNAHLQAFPQMQIMSSLAEFIDHFSAYRLLYPELAQRIGQYVPSRLQGAKFAYITFLNNAHQYLDDLRRFQIPFVLNLYPGGGLGLNEAESDQKLLRVLASPLLKAIIVTQPVVENYLNQLAQTHSLRLPPLHLIQGVVANPDYFKANLTQHGPRYGFGKEVLDVCFVAENYMAGAANKGLPEFVQAMQGLKDLPELRIHLVGGGYSAADYQVPGLASSIQYHGRLSTTQLREFFANVDIIVSPNRPGLLHAGNFDGFPTGACVEAALCQVAIVASDALQQNPGYKDQASIFLLQDQQETWPQQIERVIRHLVLQPDLLRKVAIEGQSVTQSLYSPEKQIASRQDILRKAAR
jgi:lipopolysaccharide transport system ATP-binding protein